MLTVSSGYECSIPSKYTEEKRDNEEEEEGGGGRAGVVAVFVKASSGGSLFRQWWRRWPLCLFKGSEWFMSQTAGE